MRYEWTIYTMGKVKAWDEMLSGFNSHREAMDWLLNTYQPNAGFWEELTGIKIVKETK